MTAPPIHEELESLVQRLSSLTVAFHPELEVRARILAEMAAALYFRLGDDGKERGERRLVLFVGPSGAGKSTLFNTLLGRNASRVSSVERPSTRGGLVAGLSDWGPEAPMLFPTFAKRSSRSPWESGRESTMTLLESPEMEAQGVVLVDAPDHDTHVLANRDVTFRILPWADRIVLVTSAERYGDASLRDMLEEIEGLGIPTLFVLNKVAAEDCRRLADDYASKLRDLGVTTPEVLTVGLHSLEDMKDDPSVAKIRRFVEERSNERRIEDLRTILASRISEELLLPLQRDMDARRELGESILAAAVEPARFHPADRFQGLGRVEEEGRFFLRYSHRTVFRRIAGWVRNPARLFTSTRPASLPTLDEVVGSVTDQAVACIERDRVRMREILQATPEGRRLLTDPCPGTELDAAEIRSAFQPLANDIHGWAHRMLEDLASARGRSSGALGKLGSLFGGLVLNLVVVALSMAIVPPLLHELLRALGLPAFTSEVERKLAEFRGRFQDELEVARRRQRQRYADALMALPPPAESIAALAKTTRLLDPRPSRKDRR